MFQPRDHTVAASSKNYRYSINMQVMIDAETRLVAAVGQPQPGNRNDCVAYPASRVDRAASGATVLADGGYPGTGLLIPHRRRAGGQTQLTGWKERHTPTTAGSELRRGRDAHRAGPSASRAADLERPNRRSRKAVVT